MIIEEYPYNGRTDRIRHYSDNSYTIIQNETGIEYGEAVDVYPCPYTYSEGNPIESDAEEVTPEDYQEALQRMGVDVDD